MAYTPRVLTKTVWDSDDSAFVLQTRVADSKAEETQLLFDGWALGGPMPPPRTFNDQEEAAIDARAAAKVTTEVVEAALPARLSESGLSATYATGFATPASNLSFTQVGSSTVLPWSMGSDGKVYGVNAKAGKVLVRSGDGFTTTETGADLGALGALGDVKHVGRSSAGYVAVFTSASATDVWFSTSWTTGWSKVSTGQIGPTHQLAISKPEVDPETGDPILLIGEYSQTAGAVHELWLSRNGGQTWTSIQSLVATDAANNNHCHGATFDPYSRRIWASHGDGLNAWFGYAELDTPTVWVSVPANGIGTATAATHHQPVLVATTPGFIALDPDATAGQDGIWVLDRDSGALGVGIVGLGTSGFKQYATAPYAQSSDDRRVYALFPMAGNFPDSLKVYIAATGDGGRSWHKVWEVASAATDDYTSMIVGPDSAGRLYVHRFIGGVEQLMVATEPTWVQEAPGYAKVATGSDILAALRLAGIVGPQSVGLDLQGQTAKAGNLTLTASNAQITLGNGANVSVIDTAVGTTAIRLRVGGTWVATVLSDKLELVTGKHLTLNGGNISGAAAVTATGNYTGANLTLNAANAQITLGSGAASAVIDTASGTADLRLRVGGTHTASVTASEIELKEGKNLKTGTATGSMIASSATQKIGFYGATPVVRPTATPAAATDAATTQALANDLRTKLIALGLIS